MTLPNWATNPAWRKVWPAYPSLLPLQSQRRLQLTITLQHPITFDQYDICAMAKDGSLEHLKLSILQSICHKHEIEVQPKPIRRKKIYPDLLEKAVTNYTCHETDD